MALVLKDRVKETSTTTGTGTFTLAGSATGFQSFSVIGNANTVYYAIVNLSASEWEVGLGTYTSSGTLLSRDTVLESSNSGSKVNFSAGTKDVFCTYPAEKAVTLDDVQTLSNKTIASPSVSGNLTFTGTGNRITGDFSNATVANRVAFQTSTSNSATSVHIIPSGTGTTGQLELNNVSDATNSSSLQLASTSTTASISAGIRGTGTYLPITISTGGSERIRIDASGNVGINTSSPTSFGAGTTVLQTNAASSYSANLVSSGAYTLQMIASSANGAANMGTRSNHSLGLCTNDTVRATIDSAGQFFTKDGAGNVKAAYDARAWVNFNGTGTVAIRASGNVSSITDNAAGNFTVNFSTSQSDTNYSVVGWARSDSTSNGSFGFVSAGSTDSKTTSAVQVKQGVQAGGTTYGSADSSEVNVAIFR
jgi:hypothetical protein